MINPNPFKDKLLITIASLIEDKATFLLSDISGRELLKVNKQIPAGTNVISIDKTNNLSKGTYLLTIIKSKSISNCKSYKGN